MMCAKKHIWTTSAASLRNGSWCPKCFGRSRTLKDYNLLAHSRNGKCLNLKIQNGTRFVELTCIKKHTWWTKANDFISGRWCPFCANKRHSTDDLKKIAKSRGGACLNTTYKGVNYKYKWKCINRHIFQSSFSSIKNGSWCPECTQSYGERICRAYFEKIFNSKFQKTRPKWLKNSEGNQMELDGYNAKLKLAFEHQGQHHYTYHTLYYQNKANFKKRLKDDKEKVKLCKQKGIQLIQVPQIPKLMSTENLINYISSKISDQFFKKYIKNKNINVDYNKIYNVNFEDILKKIRKKINKRGGTLLSNTYLGSTHPLDIRCAKGHLFKLLSYKILNGVWCQQCLGVGITLNDLKKIALARGGKCLSLSYKNPNTKMKWECAKGHRWEAISCSVRNMKTWCPMCAGKKVINKKILQTIAKSHGGKLLSRIFKSSIDCYRFECKLGHIWKAKAGKVVNRGQWCRKCALIKNGIKRREKTLSLIKLTAKRKGGTCLSKKFLGTNSTLKFECKNSHLFKLPYWKFKRNHWCPQCLL